MFVQGILRVVFFVRRRWATAYFSVSVKVQLPSDVNRTEVGMLLGD